MSEANGMIPLERALEIVDRALDGVAMPAETVPVRQGLGRTVCGDQLSRLELPPFDKSAMDGYAVMAGDERDEYRLLESVPAGRVPTCKLEPGTAVKVMTGAPVPEGAGKVIMVEHTSELDGKLRVHRHGKAHNICFKGEDVSVGDVILRAPAVLGALEIANLVSCGITHVEVFRRPRAAILSTGDEIVDSPDRLEPGKIMNVNGPLLCALCASHGLEVAAEAVVPDEFDKTVSALRDGLEKADILMVSGGVSVGDFDFVGAAMSRLGLTVKFNRVAVKPGKPMTFACAPGKAVFGLPGNPVSVFLMFHLFVLRAAALMTGRKEGPRRLALPLGTGFARRKAERTEYVPCRLTERGACEPVEFHGSAHLRALLEADGFFIVPKGIKELRAGETVSFMPVGGAPV